MNMLVKSTLGRSSSVKPDAQMERKNINFQSSNSKIANDDTPAFLQSIIRSAKNQEKRQIKSAIYENSKMKPREEKEKLNDCSNSSHSNRTKKLPNHSKEENFCKASKEVANLKKQSKLTKYGLPQVTPF